MKTRKCFFGFSLLCIVVWVGCDDEDGKVGPAKTADSIHCRTNGTNLIEFIYVRSTGDPITQPGIRMCFKGSPPAYLRANGLGGYYVCDASCTGQKIECTGITECGGILRAKGKREIWKILEPYIVYSAGSVSKPKEVGGGCSATCEYRTRTEPHGEVALSSCGGTMIAYDPPDNSYLFGLTANEYHALLQSQTLDPPTNGIEVNHLGLLFQDGEIGNGYPTETDFFMAVNISDPNDYFRYSAPFRFSAVFKTAEGIDLSGFRFAGRVRTDSCPQGIPIGLEIIGSNADTKTHVVRTDYFLPIDIDIPISQEESVSVYDRWTPFDDPNIWNPEQSFITLKDNWRDFCDPNVIDDPNDLYGINPDVFEIVSRLDTSYSDFESILIPERIMTVPIIPMSETEDYLYLQLKKEDLDILVLILDDWLGNNAVWDSNQDGIVNMEDLQLLYQQQ